MRNRIVRAVVEIGFIIFLFYANLLGEHAGRLDGDGGSRERLLGGGKTFEMSAVPAQAACENQAPPGARLLLEAR